MYTIYVYVYMHMFIYHTYIYRERERCVYIHIYLYIYIEREREIRIDVSVMPGHTIHRFTAPHLASRHFFFEPPGKCSIITHGFRWGCEKMRRG